VSEDRKNVRQIAELAGVSIATVSRVSRGIGQVSPETRRRVLETINTHGYRPSHLGRALAQRRHGALGLVFPGLSGPYYAELIQGFESEAVETRTSVHIVCTHLRRDSAEQVLEMARRVDGVAVLGGTVDDATLSKLAESMPVVVIGGAAPDGIASVRVDNTSAAAELTRHLLDVHGLRELAFVGTPTGSPDVTERWQGFRDAHRQVGIPVPRRPIRVAMQQHDGVIAIEKLIRDGDPLPQGIVCANDELALGVLVGALARGVVVPGDLAITGFDHVPMAALVSPPLTTVRQPIRELAATAARMLLHDAAGDLLSPDPVVLPTSLVVQSSCGCAPGDGTGDTPPRTKSVLNRTDPPRWVKT
jgi:LacI family transcriptional regulator